jgi:hypothetical protein
VRNGTKRVSISRNQSGRTRQLDQEADMDKQKAGFKGDEMVEENGSRWSSRPLDYNIVGLGTVLA